MKILYDHQTFVEQKFGGISRYFTQIISNLPNNVLPEISIKYSDNVYLKTLSEFSHILGMNDNFNRFLWGINFKGKGRIYNFFNKLNPNKYPNCKTVNIQTSISYLKKQDFDIFHPTYYNDYFLEYIGNKPFVLTIHDMIHELYPELLLDSELCRRKKILAQRANQIIAISENTKKDIIDILNIPEKKISVIYHANSLVKKNEFILNLPQKYFLFIGNRSKYKNFTFFAHVIAPILLKRKEIYVVCTGSQFSSNEILFLTNLNVRDRFINIFVTENEMYEVYNKAIAFVFPSYYEGFGIPILEAFDSSCPVLLSNSSCFPEIAQESALYYSSKDTRQMRYCIEEIIDNISLREDLISKGKERIKDFSWKDSAAQTAEVYKQVLL